MLEKFAEAVFNEFQFYLPLALLITKKNEFLIWIAYMFNRSSSI